LNNSLFAQMSEDEETRWRAVGGGVEDVGQEEKVIPIAETGSNSK
jgi:hypothetical protein